MHRLTYIFKNIIAVTADGPCLKWFLLSDYCSQFVSKMAQEWYPPYRRVRCGFDYMTEKKSSYMGRNWSYLRTLWSILVQVSRWYITSLNRSSAISRAACLSRKTNSISLLISISNIRNVPMHKLQGGWKDVQSESVWKKIHSYHWPQVASFYFQSIEGNLLATA